MKDNIINDDFISRLETIALYMQSQMKGYFGGIHRVKSYGSTVEFADFREYQLGDDIRRIDWNLYSRFEKYFIKLFVDERQMHTQIFLDCSASMGKQDKNKAHYLIKLVAALGFLSVQNMDKTSFMMMQGEYAEDLCGLVTGKESFYLSTADLENISFHGSTDIEAAITNIHDQSKNDGLSVIISDFLTESNWKKAVDYLLYHKRQVMLIQVLSPEEIDPLYNGRTFLKDIEAVDILDERNMKLRITKGNYLAYKEALKDYQAEIKQFCSKRGVRYFSVSSDSAIEELIFGRLMETGDVR
jgi:uncharacterized protein (DUF58 family)